MLPDTCRSSLFFRQDMGILPVSTAKNLTIRYFRITMNFFGDLAWWMLLAASLVMATLPSIIRPFKAVPLFITLLLWIGILETMWLRFDTVAALTGFLFSLAAGLLAFLLAVFFSGLDLMAKKRYR